MSCCSFYQNESQRIYKLNEVKEHLQSWSRILPIKLEDSNRANTIALKVFNENPIELVIKTTSGKSESTKGFYFEENALELEGCDLNGEFFKCRFSIYKSIFSNSPERKFTLTCGLGYFDYIGY